MHSFSNPANAVYEIFLGLTCLAILFGSVISIPGFFALMLDGKEQQDRQNS